MYIVRIQYFQILQREQRKSTSSLTPFKTLIQRYLHISHVESQTLISSRKTDSDLKGGKRNDTHAKKYSDNNRGGINVRV